MSKIRTWSAATVGVCVLLVIAAWFLVLAPQKAGTADVVDQTLAQNQANAQTRLKIKQLKAQYDELPTKQAELAVIKQQLPDNPALPTLIRTLSAIADTSGVTLVSLSPAAPVPFTGASASAPAAVAPTAGAATSGDGITAAGSTQLFGMATNVVISGDYASSTLFVQKLQAANDAKNGSSMSRAFLVQKITMAPLTATTLGKAGVGQVQTTVTGQVFVLKTSVVPAVSVPSTGSGSAS